jgi:hypothetical protein
MMKNRFVLIVIVFFLWNAVSYNAVLAQMSRPDHQSYPNPYRLMTEASIEFSEGIDWYVLSNRKNAPIYQSIGGSAVNRAGYLELFTVEERKGKYLKVKSMGRENVVGWMDMRHLILLQQGIKAPDTMVFHKIFIKVRVDDPGPIEPDLNSLRFRNGPGEGGKEYDFLTSPEETVRQGGLFFYLYGVHFNDQQINYQDTYQFKNADYFLIGNTPTFNIHGDSASEGVVSGWIPRRSAVLWDTRQALEVVPNRQLPAHKFLTRPLLNNYYIETNDESRKTILKTNIGKIIVDNGEAPPASGQELRNIVLGIEQKAGNVTSEYIGYTGSRQNSIGNQQPFLADLHEGASHIEVFFLIDATHSMKPCINAAAHVAKEIMNKIDSKYLKITFYGAVYRDKSEGLNRYEEWDPGQTPDISEWFDRISAYTASKDPDYEESLFYGIKQALNSWKRHFKHRLSVRVMVILGDTGDNGQGPGLEEIVSKMKENMILPLAIHFKHSWTKPGDSDLVRREETAMDKFTSHIKKIYSRIYDLPDSIEIRSVEASSIENELEKYITAAVNTASEFIKKMPQIRLGQKSIKDQVCEMAYSSKTNYLPGCKACQNMEEFMNYLETNVTGQNIASGKANVSFFLAYIKHLERENPELFKFVTSSPETGFSKAYVALKDGDIRITRPVLLISLYELQDIKYAIEEILTRYRYCEDKKTHQLLVKAMSTILGEVLQVNPDQVSREELKRWFKLSVAPETNFLGIHDILARICSTDNIANWKEFLKRLERAKKFIRDLETLKPKTRMYLDLQTTPYFWVYPEEIFPPLKDN